MYQDKPDNKEQKIAAGIITLVVIALLAGSATFYANNQQGSASTTTTVQPSSSISASATPSSSPGGTANTSNYKDGTYSASSDYYVPHGSESIKVTLTISNGTVTDSSIQNSEYDNESAQFQQGFAAEYKSSVVGKPISSLQLDYVAGASDTTQGFNDALVAVFIVAAIKSTPDWGHVATGLLPGSVDGNGLSYWYFAVGLIAASLMPYEIYFYSSGGIEEKWKAKNLGENRLNAYLGFGIGALVVIGIIMTAANVLLPQNISPDFVGTPVLGVIVSLGQVGGLAALLGLLFAISGATVETAFAGAYNLSQFAGWKWGRHNPPTRTPRFTASWLIFLALGAVVIMSGIDPVQLTEYAVIFSVVIMPLTYYPVLKIARDKKIMGNYANNRVTTVLANVYLVIICLVSLAAVPLMILSQQGSL